MGTTDLEKQNPEAHVDLCEQRYKNLETRPTKIEEKVESISTEDIHAGNKSHGKSYYRCNRNYCCRSFIP